MDRYTIGFLILVGWFVCFRMFPTKIEREDTSICSISVNPSQYRDVYETDASRGKQLFDANCARCHRMSHHNTLSHLRERVPSGKWLMAFIRNSSALIQGGDAFANKLYEESSKAEMPAFPELSDIDIAEIVMYIERQERK